MSKCGFCLMRCIMGLWLGFSILMLFSCDDTGRSWSNPVDPKNTPDEGGTTTPDGSSQTDSGTGNTDNAPSTTTGVCLAPNCTAPTVTAPTFTINNIVYWPYATGCTLLETPTVVKSLQSNRLTIVYRAYHASVGRNQLYARGITISADGTMAFDSDPVNLLSTCDGNTSGVTAWSITGYRESTGVSSLALNLSKAENVSDLAISVTCVNPAQSANIKISVTDPTYAASTATTVSFLSTLGAVGNWPEKGVYLKSDGTSLNPDGTAGSVVVSLPSGGAINSVIGSDSSGVYVSNVGTLSASVATPASGRAYYFT